MVGIMECAVALAQPLRALNSEPRRNGAVFLPHNPWINDLPYNLPCWCKTFNFSIPVFTDEAEATGRRLLAMGFAYSFANKVDDPRKFGIRKSKVAQSSLTWFWTGVPVRTSL
jgi:hypothetical protein